jgi:2-alkenal reductase
MDSSENLSENAKGRATRYLAYLLIAILGGVIGGILVLLLSSSLTSKDTVVQVPTETPPIIASAQEISLDINTAVTDAVDRVAPAVVTVINHLPPRRSFFGNVIEQSGSGSGAIISEDGYIVTNFHVVQEAERLEVVFADGTILPAELVGVDPYGDLAIIHTNGEMPGIAYWGNSDALKPGETVIAIGSPLGAFMNTVTVGVVSATGRSIETDRNYKLEGLIQTDAAINQGNSGGPLVNLAGEIVGINTLIVRGGGSGGAVAEGLGFAVPSNVSRAVAESLILEGSIARPYLGANWGVITPDVASRFDLPVENGIYLTEIVPGGPAELGGLQMGDILIAINGTFIDSDNPFINQLFTNAPGEQVTFTLVRNGDEIRKEVELGKM